MLKFPDVKYYKTDLTGENPDNKVTREYHSREGDSKDVIFLPRQGHFFHENFKMLKPNGDEYDLGVDYEFYDISRSLTGLVKNKTIGLFIKLLNTEITDWYCTYQVVGNFSIIDRDFASKILSALNDDRPVYFKDIKDMLKWFPPELHQHDLRYEIHSFKDLIDQIIRIEQVYNVLPDRETVSINHFYSTISFYIADFKKRLKEAVDLHDAAKGDPYSNAHGLTAKKAGLGNVDNYKTATLIQIIEGIETQLHITADLTKQVVAQYAKESDHLIHKGVLPIIRYGNNNFIPPGIEGSYEGLGGTNFNAGFNIEPDGTALILTQRNDGKTTGLYFLRNRTSDVNPEAWEFTAYKYAHPKAIQEGIALNYVVSGSDGRFIIVGNGSTYYWSYCNGTFDPAKHTLNRFPQAMIDAGVFSGGINKLRLITDGNPDKIMLFRRWDQTEMYNDPNKVRLGWDLPTYDNLGPDTFAPATPAGGWDDTVGFSCWELNPGDNNWKQVIFKYSNVGKTAIVTSPYYVPFKYRIASGLRPDGSTKFGLFDSLYRFKFGINWWINYQYQFLMGMYDRTKKRLGLRFIFTGYGIDERTLAYSVGANSYAFSMENAVYGDGTVTYDVVKGKGMKSLVSVDNTQPGGIQRSSGFNESVMIGYAGSIFGMKYGSKYVTMGSQAYSSLPAGMGTMELANDPAFIDYDKWVNAAFSSSGRTTSHNDVNPLGLTVGMYCDCYLLPTLGNANTYGSITTASVKGKPYTLWYRRLDAMNADKTFKAPNTNFTIYGSTVKGYPLANDVRPVDLNFLVAINTLTVTPSDPKWAEYMGHYFSHHTLPIPWNGTWDNTASNQTYVQEATVDFGSVVKFNPTKTLLLGPVMDSTIIPMIQTWGNANGHAGDLENIRATYQLYPANLKGGNSDQFLYVATGITSGDVVFSVACLIQFTGGSYVGGVRTPTGATLIGNIIAVNDTQVQLGESRYRVKGANMVARVSVDVYASIRPVIAQQGDGSTVIFSDTAQCFQTVGDGVRTGFIANVTLAGLQKYETKRNYYISATQIYSPHPYYKVIYRNRSLTAGACIAGNGIALDANNIYENLRTNVFASGLFLNTSNYIESAFTVYFKSSENVIFGGNEYTLPSGFIDLYDIDPTPNNKTFYCYLVYKDGVVKYSIEPIPLAESYSRALLATINTNATGIFQIHPMNVFTMNGFRIGNERHGSTIPAATGVITTAGQTAGWADNNEDLS